MTRFPRLFLFALALLAVGLACIPAEAAGQPGGPRGGPFGGMRGGPFGGGLNLGMVASNAQAQEKLALTDAQKEAAAAAIKASRPDGRGGMPNFQDMTQEERDKAMKEMVAARQKRQEDLAKALKEALGAEKFAKLELLAAGVALRAGPRGLADAAVAKVVGISDDSQKKVAQLVEASNKKTRELFQGGGDPEEVQGKIKELTTALNKEISGALTAEEKEKVKAAVDAAADIKIEFGRRGGGRGGRGGGGGGAQGGAN